MTDDESVNFEWVKFHWEKWRCEASRVWRHLAFGSIGLVFACLYQFDVIKFSSTAVALTPGENDIVLKACFWHHAGDTN